MSCKRQLSQRRLSIGRAAADISTNQPSEVINEYLSFKSTSVAGSERHIALPHQSAPMHSPSVHQKQRQSCLSSRRSSHLVPKRNQSRSPSVEETTRNLGDGQSATKSRHSLRVPDPSTIFSQRRTTIQHDTKRRVSNNSPFIKIAENMITQKFTHDLKASKHAGALNQKPNH